MRAEKAAGNALTDLPMRLEALAKVVDLAGPRVTTDPQAFDSVAFAEHVIEKANGRLRHGTTHTLVALLGATGAGKSSVANALVGTDVATTGVRRPTTSSTLACIWGDDDAGALLDWLNVASRHGVDSADPALAGLVLLDVPDHDSVAIEHRLEMERVAEHADMLLWVTDPEKYADAKMHRYLQQLEGHSAVTAMVLNKVDRLSKDDLALCRSDLGRLLVADGLSNSTVIGVSATTGFGITELHGVLADAVNTKRVVAERLSADVAVAVSDLNDALGSDGTAEVSRKTAKSLADDLVSASGIDAVTEAVSAGYRHDAGLATGWPVTRWAVKLRPHPLRRKHLGTGSAGRTNLPGIGGANEARARAAIRRSADEVTRELHEPWPQLVREAATPDPAVLRDQVDGAIADSVRAAGRSEPRWWSAVGALQLALVLALLAGLAWLAAIFVVQWFQLPDPPTPDYRGIPIPTVLALGGAGLGIAVAFVARLFARLGAKRRARRAQKLASDAVRTVSDKLVLAPMRSELERRNEIQVLLAVAAG